MSSDSDIGDSQDGVAKTKGIMALIGKFELGILFYIPLWNLGNFSNNNSNKNWSSEDWVKYLFQLVQRHKFFVGASYKYINLIDF